MANGQIMQSAIRDSAAGRDGRNYWLTQILELQLCKVRVKVLRNSYSDQSYAVASVLSERREWTELCSQAPNEWWEATPLPQSVHTSQQAQEALTGIAARLAQRANRILG